MQYITDLEYCIFYFELLCRTITVERGFSLVPILFDLNSNDHSYNKDRKYILGNAITQQDSNKNKIFPTLLILLTS
jgi:hypothetical protein